MAIAGNVRFLLLVRLLYCGGRHRQQHARMCVSAMRLLWRLLLQRSGVIFSEDAASTLWDLVKTQTFGFVGYVADGQPHIYCISRGWSSYIGLASDFRARRSIASGLCQRLNEHQRELDRELAGRELAYRRRRRYKTLGCTKGFSDLDIFVLSTVPSHMAHQTEATRIARGLPELEWGRALTSCTTASSQHTAWQFPLSSEALTSPACRYLGSRCLCARTSC